jgi:hypothetical protein
MPSIITESAKAAFTGTERGLQDVGVPNDTVLDGDAL